MKIPFLYSLRNLWTRKTRTLLTALGIVLGVSVILAINIANSSTLASINKIFDEASGLADLVIVPSSLTGQGFSEATLGTTRASSRTPTSGSSPGWPKARSV